MLNATQVWHRIQNLPQFKGKNLTQFRALVYVQTFTPAAGAVPTANQAILFPGGAVILGISASGFVPGVSASGQSYNNRQLFQVDFSYPNNEGITIGGPVMADALLGGGDSNIFPAQEMVLGINQQINCRVANVTTGALTVHVAYHCLVLR